MRIRRLDSFSRRGVLAGLAALGGLFAVPPRLVGPAHAQRGRRRGSQRGSERRAVAVLEAPGVGPEALEAALAALSEALGLEASRVIPEHVRAGALEAHDALLVTGGRSSRQARALGEEGCEAIRRFVRGGGGYVGICAGSYLAMQVPARERASGEASIKVALAAAEHATGAAWQRGIAPIAIAAPDGSARATLHYANGPLMTPIPVEGLPPVRVLARFEGEVFSARGGTAPGEMRGTPALLATSYGRGHVVLFSPNPTLAPARPAMLVRALERVARAEPVPSLAWLSGSG